MIDLHIHTNNSDGQFDVIDILKKAEDKKLKIISITDHNNVSAYKQIDDISKYYSGQLIKGVELEFVYKGILMDMLGYNIDIEKISKEEFIIKNLQHSTLEKENEILNFFKQVCDNLKIVYTIGLQVKEMGSMANDVIRDDIIKYEENKEILTELKIIGGSFYRGHMCNPQSPFFVDQTKGKEDIYSVTNIIKNAGGMCFLAHIYAYNVENTENLLNEIYNLNLIDGIECYHKIHTKEKMDYLIDYCNVNNLKKSGGSDYHNSTHFLGYGNDGTIEIDENIISDWEEKD